MLSVLPRSPSKIDATQIQQKLDDLGFSISHRSIERDLTRLYEEQIFPIERDDRSRPYGWSLRRPVNMPAMDSATALSYVLVEQHIQNILPTSVIDKLEDFFLLAHSVLQKTKGRKNTQKDSK